MSTNLDQEFDVVIVGAGIGGATVAKSIIEAGGRDKKILIIEAGRNTGMSADKYLSHVLAFQEAEAKLPNSPYADNPNAPQPSEASLRQLVSQPTPNSKPTSTVDNHTGYMVQTGPLPFSSSYTRALGGTTLHWLGTCLRMLPTDFKLKTNYGQGVDWPIDYEDLKPYYKRAERDIIGVAGDVADQVYPGIDPSYFGDYEFPMERVPSSYLDQYLAERIDDLEVTLADETFTVKVSNTPVGRNSTPRGDYKPVGAVGNAAQGQRCEGNSSCIPICPVQAKYNALKTLSALQRNHGTGSDTTVEIVAQTVASKIEVGDDGEISGIVCKVYKEEASAEYEEVTVRGKVYVLAAHAIENAKLMLASDVANSSGQVGRNLMDHPLILTWGLLPDKIWSFRGPGSTSGIPAFRDGDFRKRHSAFRVEIGNWGWSFAAGAPNSTFEDMLRGHAGSKGKQDSEGCNEPETPLAPVKPLWGRALRQRMSEVLPRQFRMAWEFEQIPEDSNFITIDDNYRDQLGNHRPVIRYDLPEYVKAAMEAARDASRQVFSALDLEQLYENDTGQPKENPVGFPAGWDYTRYDSTAPGYVTYGGRGYAYEGAGHVAGTHRMGDDCKTSVVNRHQQSWDHSNLFMVGCGNMPTIGTSNPTLTMTALAIQAGENISAYLEGELS